MSLLDRIKDIWTTLPGLAAIVLAVMQYIHDFAATNAWPPSGMALFLFFSGLLNVVSTIKKTPTP